MAGLTLACRVCGDTRQVNPNLRVGSQPVLQWFVERGEKCEPCYTDAGHRATDPATSRAGAKDATVRSGSQRHKLLVAYGSGIALTADEAMRRADVNERSCYWKRVSELLEGGLIEDTGIERRGEQGSLQRVNQITQRGIDVLALTTPRGEA